MIKDLLVRLGLIWDGLKKGLNNSIKLVQSSAKKIDDASQSINESLNDAFSGKFRGSISELNDLIQTNRDRLVEARAELQRLQSVLREQKKGSEGFKETEAAIRRQKKVVQEYTRDVSELNIQLRDQKTSLADSRLQAEDNSSAMEALGRAVNAASMATLLLGDDNKKLQPAINAVRLAMAGASAAVALYNLSLRENSILTALGTKLQRAFVVVAGTGTAAMQTFRVALASTGIGVLVVALGTLIGKMMEAANATDKLNDALKQLDRDNEFTLQSLEDQNDAIDRVAQQQILLAKISGKTEREIQQIRDESYKKKIANIDKEIDSEFDLLAKKMALNNLNIKDVAERNKANIEADYQYSQRKRQLEKEMTALEQQMTMERLQLDLDEKTKKEDNQKKETEKRRQELERQLKDYIEYQNIMMQEGVKLQQMLIDKMAEGKEKELAQLKLNYQEDLKGVKYNAGLKREIIEKYNRDVKGINEKYANQEFNAETRRVNQAIQNAQNLANAKRNISKKTNADLIKEQEKFNAKIAEQSKAAINALIKAVITESSNALARAFEGVSESSEISLKILKLQQQELEATMKDMEKSELERLQARQQYLKNEEQILESSASNISQLFKGILLSIADFLVELGTGLIVAATATEAFKKTLLKNPKAAIAAGAVAVAAGLATRAIIARGPKFANGGIVSGPTLGLVGEYPGASTNPEVIAPLDKLKSMIGGTADGGNFIAETRVSGRDLALVLSRYNKDAQRG